MMDTLFHILWLVVTILPGAAWLARGIPPGTQGRFSLIAGYGLLLGLLLMPMLLRALDLVGIPFSFFAVACGAVLLALIAWLLPLRANSSATPTAGSSILSRTEKILLALCLALIGARLMLLGLELNLRPVFSWDSKQHWGKQARVLFDQGQLVPYVTLSDWLRLADPQVYTSMHPDYPVTVPLMQVWANLPWADWNDSRMGIPWLLAFVAIGLVMFGQLRSAGLSPVIAVVASYMVLSLPFLNMQVALAGYADLMVAACYLGAVAAFANWVFSRQAWQGWLALFLGLSLPFIKNEGFYWALTLLPGLLMVLLGWRKGLMVSAALALVALVLLLLLPGNLVIAGFSSGDLDLGYRPQSWSSLGLSFLVHDNWHLLPHILLALLLFASVWRRDVLAGNAPLLAAAGGALLCYLALYLFTRHAYGAVNFTSLNRVALQIVPVFGFVAAILFGRLAQSPAPEQPLSGQG